MFQKILCATAMSALFLMTFFVDFTFAKCPMVKYVVRGRVITAKAQIPVQDARVVVFYDDNLYFHSAGFDNKEVTFRTGRAGEFEVVAYYPSEESSFFIFNAQCNEKPVKMEIIIIKDDNVMRKIFTVDNVLIQKENDYGVIKVPDIQIGW